VQKKVTSRVTAAEAAGVQKKSTDGTRTVGTRTVTRWPKSMRPNPGRDKIRGAGAFWRLGTVRDRQKRGREQLEEEEEGE